MDLKSLIERKSAAADYMLKEITHICKNLPKRDPGSEGEKQACEYMGKIMKDYGCDRVFMESFTEHPGSYFGWIYFAVTFALIGAVTIHFAPIVTAVVNGLAVLIAVLQFGLYKKIMDPFFKKKTGHNVTAIKTPKGEVKRRIFFNGHVDAVWEWPVNYHFGGVAFEAHSAIGIGGLVYFLIVGVIACVKSGMVGKLEAGGVRTAALVGLLFVPFWIGLYFLWNERHIVDGANDNLTGCYMGIALMKALQDEGIEFENTEVGVIITGSEEAGLRGAMAWAKAHKNDFNDVPTFIYSYDTIHDPKYLMTNYRNLNATLKTDKDVGDLFMEAAEDLGIHCLKGMVPPMGGATDDAAFAMEGFRATGITGLNHKLENYYHTRRDTYDNLNEQGIADCFAVTVKVLEKFDNGAKQ